MRGSTCWPIFAVLQRQSRTSRTGESKRFDRQSSSRKACKIGQSSLQPLVLIAAACSYLQPLVLPSISTYFLLFRCFCRAMGGSMLFQDALKARLDLMRPSTNIVEKCLRVHPPRLSPGKPSATAYCILLERNSSLDRGKFVPLSDVLPLPIHAAGVAEFVELLHARGTDVFLVSGGFRLMINPVADLLKIPRERVFANTILFGKDGSYAGFDAAEPTSRDGGKPHVVKTLKERHGYSPVVMIGDGATDMQARPPAEAFIGYGGVAVRGAVRAGADWFVYDFKDLIEAVKPRQ
ncbi:unnamed protein product [Phaeothamnion confervicola]